MPKRTEPAGDLDEFTAIKQIDELEINLIDSLLCRIDKSQETKADELLKLLELRYLCMLRKRLLTNIEADYPAKCSSPAQKNPESSTVGASDRSRLKRTG